MPIAPKLAAKVASNRKAREVSAQNRKTLKKRVVIGFSVVFVALSFKLATEKATTPAPVTAPALVAEPVVAPVEPKVSPEAEFRQAMEAEAAAAMDRVSQGPTWSGAEFEGNQRQAWAECKTNPAAPGC